MNKTRPLFLVFVLLLAGLFAINSYADEVTIDWKSGTYTGQVSYGVPDGQGTWTHHDGRKYVGKWEDTAKSWEGPEYQDGKIVATYSEGVAEAQ